MSETVSKVSRPFGKTSCTCQRSARKVTASTGAAIRCCWSNFHARPQKSFGEQLTVLHLFKHPTIGSLAAQLSHGEPSLEQANWEAAHFENRMTGKQGLLQRLEQHKRVA